MPISELPKFIRENYEIYEWRHALAILKNDFPEEHKDLIDLLTRFRLQKSWISEGGGRKSKISKWIDSELFKKGWKPKNFDTKITVDESVMESPTHEIDCYKNRVALEIEWNNKDPFFDRDLSIAKIFVSNPLNKNHHKNFLCLQRRKGFEEVNNDISQ